MINSLLKIATQAPDFLNNQSNALPFPTWAYIVGIIIIVIIVIFTGFTTKNIDITLLSLLLGSLLVALFATGIYAFISMFQESKEDTSYIQEFQSWTQETYQIDVTEDQAEILINGRVNMDDTSTTISPIEVLVTNAYGDMIKITLVTEGDTVKLYQSSDISTPTPKQ